MPEETQNPAIEMDPAAVAAANAETVAKLHDQGRDKQTVEIDLKHTSDALDELRSAAEKRSTEEVDPPVVETKPAAPATEPTPEQKEAAEKAEAERIAHVKHADEFFKDSPKLPAGASPKSSEAFSSIKIKAAQEISARDSQLDEAKKKIAEYEAKLKDAVPPEITRELEDHRQWRAKLDVEADPKFKEFDKQVASSQEFIYSQLAKSPAITPDIIEQIKKHGGPENVILEKIFAAVKDPTLQRIVEAKVADIEQAKWSKEQAIKSTKANIGVYLEERNKAFQESTTSHNTATRKEFEAISSTFAWSKEKPVDPKADESTRKAAEAHNTFVKNIKGQLEEAFEDPSVRMRAIMLAATAELLYLKPQFSAQSEKITTLEKSLSEANAKLEKLKSASVGRLQEGGAAPGGSTIPKIKESDIFDKRAGDALDDIAKQVIGERARAASA